MLKIEIFLDIIILTIDLHPISQERLIIFVIQKMIKLIFVKATLDKISYLENCIMIFKIFRLILNNPHFFQIQVYVI